MWGQGVSFICTKLHDIWKYESKVMAYYVTFFLTGQFGQEPVTRDFLLQHSQPLVLAFFNFINKLLTI